MDRIIYKLLILVVLLSVGFEVLAGARVFLLAGQSNMVGSGRYDELESPYNEPLEGVKMWHKGVWKPLGPRTNNNKEKLFGPEIAFAHAMKKAYPKDEIYLIKVAAGGTSLYHSWALPAEDAPPKSGGMYRMFIARCTAALKNLTDAEIRYTIDGMLWMQGESDAKGGQGEQYKVRLTAFIKHMRDHFEVDDMPFILGRIIKHYDTPEGDNAKVRAAQEAVADEMDYVAWFSTDHYELFNAGHYNTEGLVRMGHDFAAGLLELKKSREKADTSD